LSLVFLKFTCLISWFFCGITSFIYYFFNFSTCLHLLFLFFCGIISLSVELFNLCTVRVYVFFFSVKMALADVRRLDDLYRVIGNNEGEESRQNLIRLLQGEGLVKKCMRANTRLLKDGQYKGGYCSYCSRCQRSLMTGTFFENTSLFLRNVLILLFFLVFSRQRKDYP
ncbi:hypothetical protein C0J52_17490, partial [Blattella germanica]